MPRRNNRRAKTSSPPGSGAVDGVTVLPALATPAQIAAALQVTARTVLYWSERGIIPTALRQGKIIRFHPPAVADALGITMPKSGDQIYGPTNPANIPHPEP